MNLGKPNLEVFADTLLEAARQDHDLLVLTSDSRGSARLDGFCQALPEQVVEVGIAEQNLVGVAAGLAAAGKKAYAVSPACFLTARSLEQIKSDVAYSDHPVKLVGISAGVSYGALGATHHSLHDFAALQAINNLDIVVPGDNYETRQAILASLSHPRPLYLRFGKKPLPHLHSPKTHFEIGKAIHLSHGEDVQFIATGETVYRAVMAQEILRQAGISAGVTSMHTLKPLDREAVLQAARSTRLLITVEEHSVYGGLGATCAALLLEHGLHPLFKIVAFPDEYMVSGSQDDIFRHYGISPEGLAQTAMQLLKGAR
ncbi:MAG: transketolase family protein [Chloroflexota bacterium]